MKRLSLIVHTSGIILGAILGYVYYAKVGCVSGHCMIWANPWIATSYGALLGFLVAGLLPIGRKKESTEVSPE